MLKPLKEHAEAIRNAKAMMLDKRFSKKARDGLADYLKHLVEDFSIDDGYVSRINRIEWRVEDETK